MNHKEVIKKYVHLDRMSETPHGFKGCCPSPTHDDSTPSFHINVKKGIYKCFGCGYGGQVFDLLINGGAPFDEAIEFLLEEYDRAEKEDVGLEYYLGRKIPKSMLDRGFTIETLKHFGVGYDDVAKLTTIPLKLFNKLVGVQYRRYPKSFWYSDNFIRDNFVYNFGHSDNRIITEGGSDVWRGWQHGTENISATLGAEVTVQQSYYFREFKRLLLAYDNDYAGYLAAFKTYEYCKHDTEVLYVPYHASDVGESEKDDWLKAVDNPVSFTEFELRLMDKMPETYDKIIRTLQRAKLR